MEATSAFSEPAPRTKLTLACQRASGESESCDAASVLATLRSGSVASVCLLCTDTDTNLDTVSAGTDSQLPGWLEDSCQQISDRLWSKWPLAGGKYLLQYQPSLA